MDSGLSILKRIPTRKFSAQSTIMEESETNSRGDTATMDQMKTMKTKTDSSECTSPVKLIKSPSLRLKKGKSVKMEYPEF